MSRIMLIALGTVMGLIEGIVFYVIVNVSLDTPFGIFQSGELWRYPALIAAGIGAFSGAVLGWGVHIWMTKHTEKLVHGSKTERNLGPGPSHTNRSLNQGD